LSKYLYILATNPRTHCGTHYKIGVTSFNIFLKKIKKWIRFIMISRIKLSLLHIVPFCEGPNKKSEGFAKEKQKT
jgi:hypothetical protein